MLRVSLWWITLRKYSPPRQRTQRLHRENSRAILRTRVSDEKTRVITEKKLREAIENGEFDNLPGKGNPVDLKENPFEDPDLRMVHRLLRNAGFAPAWIEERKDIDLNWTPRKQS